MKGLPEEFTIDFLARLDQLRIRTKREYLGASKGSHLSPRRGSSLEFADYRHYVPGDDFRYIDWGLYGRSDRLYVRLFKEEEDLLTYIFLDASASMAYPAADGKFARATSIALALAYVALAAGDRVMTRLLQGDVPGPATGFLYGRNRIVELGTRLSDVRPGGRLDFASTLARELIGIKRAGKAFVISDFLMPFNAIAKGLGLFRAANMDVTAVQVLGALELEAQGLEGDVELVDSENGERIRVSLGARARRQYRETLMRHARDVRGFCLAQGIRYVLCTTASSFQDFFLEAATQLGLAH